MIDLSALEYRINELERRLANVALIGTVSEADYAQARVRVKIGNITTAWLPWLTRRAGVETGDWWAPESGEQVLVISPSGEPAQGVAIPALYSATNKAPINDENIRRIYFGDGSFVEYNASAHQLTVSVNGGDTIVNTTGNLSASADGNASITAGGDVTADGATVTLTADSSEVKADGTNVILNGGAAGGVVCRNHICAFTGSAHPDACTSVTAGDAV